MAEYQADRISATFGMKFPGPVEYSSINFSVSYTSDVKDGESLAKAWTRVKSEIEKRATEYHDEYGQLQAEEEG